MMTINFILHVDMIKDGLWLIPCVLNFIRVNFHQFSESIKDMNRTCFDTFVLDVIPSDIVPGIGYLVYIMT
jgi:hypothetical protein